MIAAQFDRATGKEIAKDVVIVGLSALATELARWAVERLRAPMTTRADAQASQDVVDDSSKGGTS